MSITYQSYFLSNILFFNTTVLKNLSVYSVVNSIINAVPNNFPIHYPISVFLPKTVNNTLGKFFINSCTHFAYYSSLVRGFHNHLMLQSIHAIPRLLYLIYQYIYLDLRQSTSVTMLPFYSTADQ